VPCGDPKSGGVQDAAEEEDNLKTAAVLFSGGGGTSLGLEQAGYKVLWAVEGSLDIANAYRSNFPDHECITGYVQDVDPRKLEPVDLLSTSPPCPSFSVANANKGETANDIAIAVAVCDYIKVLCPRVYIMENVIGYKKSQSYAMIVETLETLEYFVEARVVDCADYSVPQNRRRLILRACRDGMMPPLPVPTRWIGWYEAIEDLLPGLKECELARWQVERLPSMYRNLLVHPTDARTMPTRDGRVPSFTIMSNSDYPRAILVSDRQSKGDVKVAISRQNEPSLTITSNSACHPLRAFLAQTNLPPGKETIAVQTGELPAWGVTSQTTGKTRAWLEQGRVVRVDLRCQARFQGFPDTWKLTGKAGLDGKIIGNAVPPPLMCAIAKGFL
jgi:DNA (cytosine-5)-methyltransferase 1